MEILLVADTRFDYSQDLLYSGLNKLDTNAKIIDYPTYWPYHLPVKKYPKNMGYTNLKEGLNPSRHWRRATKKFKDYDLILVGNCRPKTLNNYLDILDQIPDSIPRVFIDGGDREEIGGDAIRVGGWDKWQEIEKKRPFDLVLKREYFKDVDYPDRIVPFPFAVNLDALEIPKKVDDRWLVNFWATESHPIRTQALDILKGQFDCDENGTSKDKDLTSYNFKGADYHQEMARTKISISLRGGGWDTLRYWEIPALGPLLVSQKLRIVIPNDFIENEHIVYCKDDLSDLIEICQHYLDNEAERLKISEAANRHLKLYHTNESRAKYFLDVIHKKFGL